MLPRDAAEAHDTPAAADPRPGANPGYAEDEPRDKADAQDPRTGKVPNPEIGGLNRPLGTDAAPDA